MTVGVPRINDSFTQCSLGDDEGEADEAEVSKKAKSSKCKPKVSDFDEPTREVLNFACADFRAWSSAVDAFAGLATRRKWACEAFERANKEIRIRRGEDPIRYSEDIRETVCLICLHTCCADGLLFSDHAMHIAVARESARPHCSASRSTLWFPRWAWVGGQQA